MVELESKYQLLGEQQEAITKLVEEKIEIVHRSSIDITDILYRYQILFKRIEVLRALKVGTELSLQDRNLKLNSNQSDAALFYLSILNNEEYKIDWHMFCEVPCRRIINYASWSIMVMFKIYRDRIIEPLIPLYPELKKYLEETKIWLDQAINQIDGRITIIIPGKIKIAKDETYINDRKLILGSEEKK